MATILEKLEHARLERNIQQQELERAAKLSNGRISKWKDGKGSPSYRQARDIADALGVSLEWLCDDDARLEDWQKREGLSPIEGHVLFLARELGANEAAELLTRELLNPARKGRAEGANHLRTPVANVTYPQPPKKRVRKRKAKGEG